MRKTLKFDRSIPQRRTKGIFITKVTKIWLITNKPKARVTLARAIYSPAQILLLDDVLAALDVHTARWVVEKCLQGDLVRDRTVILVVSHNL